MWNSRCVFFSLHEQKIIQEEVEVALNTRQKLAVPLIEKEVLSSDSRRFRFGLPSKNHKLGLPIGKHFFVSGRWNGEFVMRPYTPVTGDEVTGFVDLVIKVREVVVWEGAGRGRGEGVLVPCMAVVVHAAINPRTPTQMPGRSTSGFYQAPSRMSSHGVFVRFHLPRRMQRKYRMVHVFPPHKPKFDDNLN